MKKLIATVALTATLILSTGAAAMAAEPGAATASPDSLCSGSTTVYKSTIDGGAFTQATGGTSSITGSTGVTLSLSTSTTFTVSGSITSSSAVSGAQVIATVKANNGKSIEASRSAKASSSWTVPSTYKEGRLTVGAVKYKGTVTKYLENSSCTDVKQGTSASFNAPQTIWTYQTTKVS